MRGGVQAYDERQTQTTMTQFLTFSQRFAKFKSVRLQRAVKGVSGKASEDLHYMDTASPSQPKRARASKPGGRPHVLQTLKHCSVCRPSPWHRHEHLHSGCLASQPAGEGVAPPLGAL